MKILCPFHKDTNPSMHVYEEYAHCFVCGGRAKTEDVLSGAEIEVIKKEPTNIPMELDRVRRLPKIHTRGLLLPADSEGYYIVWPDESFYKKRLFEGKQRYIGPRGRRPTPFIYKGSKEAVVLVEGELNAMSLYEGCQLNLAKGVNWLTIVSFGGVNNITDYINYSLQFKRIYVIVDRDIPGVIAGVKFKDGLLKHKRRVDQLIAVDNDINEILQKEGKEGVSRWWKETVGV